MIVDVKDIMIDVRRGSICYTSQQENGAAHLLTSFAFTSSADLFYTEFIPFILKLFVLSDIINIE